MKNMWLPFDRSSTGGGRIPGLVVSPRPLVRDLPLVKIQMFDVGTGADIDLTEQVDLPAVMELLGEAECCPSGGLVLTAMRNIRWTSNFPAGRALDRDTGEQRRFCCGQFPQKLPGVSWKAVSCGRSPAPAAGTLSMPFSVRRRRENKHDRRGDGCRRSGSTAGPLTHPIWGIWRRPGRRWTH